MLLAVDVGNTQTVAGLYEVDELRDHWRIATERHRTGDELGALYGRFLDFEDVTGICLASSVPQLVRSYEDLATRYLQAELLVLGPGVRTGIPIRYDDPREVGPDRIANAAAAFERYGGPCVVVDFGTATTVEAISAAGEYLGGAIFPGVEIAMDALFGRAAGLRRVELQAPKHVIGKSTAESIQSGALYGFSAQVDGLVDRFVAELGECTVISTGGLADLISPHARTVQHFEPWLTLYGLRIIFERNS